MKWALLILALAGLARGNFLDTYLDYDPSVEKLSNELFEDAYYYDELEALKASVAPYTVVFPAPTVTGILLLLTAVVIWCCTFWFIGKATNDRFGSYGKRRIEAKYAPIWLRWICSLMVIFLEVPQLLILTFNPTIKWQETFATAIKWTKVVLFLFPESLYPYGWIAGISLFGLFQLLILLPVLLDFINYRYSTRRCMWYARFFTTFPKFTGVLRDLYIFCLPLPWMILFVSPVSCTHYVYELPRVTVALPYVVECWSGDRHWYLVAVGIFCGLWLYVTMPLVVTSKYFSQKTTDCDFSARFQCLQFQVKVFVAIVFVMFHESYRWAYLGCVCAAYVALLSVTYISRPCLIEKVNFHRIVGYGVAFFASLVALVNEFMITSSIYSSTSVIPFVTLAVVIFWLIPCVALSIYYFAPHRNIYLPVNLDNGDYQGDHVLSDQARHGFGTMAFEDGRRYVGSFYYGNMEGKGLMWKDSDETYYDGVWKRGQPNGHGSGNILKDNVDPQLDSGRDLESAFAFHKERAVQAMLLCLKSDEHKDDLLKALGFDQGEENSKRPTEEEQHTDIEEGVQEHQEEQLEMSAGPGLVLPVPDMPDIPGTADQGQMDKTKLLGDYPVSVADLQGPSVPDNQKYYYYYQGQWKNGVPHGVGTKSFEDKEEYHGQFVDGKEHGQGQWTLIDGTIIDGTWSNGYLEMDGKRLLENYRGGWRYGLEHGEGKREYEDGSSYDGTWIAGLKCSKGVQKGPSGDEYVGEWKDGKPDGNGRVMEIDGSYYDGGWRDGLKSGWGREAQKGGDTYEGNWEVGKRSGWGTLEAFDGSAYKGGWKDGLFHGEGHWVGPLDEVYKGPFQAGMKHGPSAVYQLPNGLVYTGTFADDVPNDQGNLDVPGLGVYKGTWKNAKKHGKGVFEFKNRCRFEGEWVDDKIMGHGVMSFEASASTKEITESLRVVASRASLTVMFGEEQSEDTGSQSPVPDAPAATVDLVEDNLMARGGVQYEGNWIDGVMQGSGTMRFADGATYTGDWDKNIEHGMGIRVYADGERYEGSWGNRKRHGRGVMQYIDGRVYTGEWVNDMRDGAGRVRYPNDTVFQGNFTEDKMLPGGQYVRPNEDKYKAVDLEKVHVGDLRSLLVSREQNQANLYNEKRAELEWDVDGTAKEKLMRDQAREIVKLQREREEMDDKQAKELEAQTFMRLVQEAKEEERKETRAKAQAAFEGLKEIQGSRSRQDSRQPSIQPSVKSDQPSNAEAAATKHAEDLKKNAREIAATLDVISPERRQEAQERRARKLLSITQKKEPERPSVATVYKDTKTMVSVRVAITDSEGLGIQRLGLRNLMVEGLRVANIQDRILFTDLTRNKENISWPECNLGPFIARGDHGFVTLKVLDPNEDDFCLQGAVCFEDVSIGVNENVEIPLHQRGSAIKGKHDMKFLAKVDVKEYQE